MRVGIVGYGNLGRGVEAAVRQNEDMELVGVFTGRNPEEIKLETDNVRVYSVNELENFQNGIDVVVLCGGSLMLLTVLIHMQRYRSILKRLIRKLRKERKRH